MNNFTKYITAYAVLSLFAYTANAQTATFTGDAAGTAPVDSLVFEPGAAGLVPNVAENADPEIPNVIATTAVVDPVTGAITTTIVNQVASWDGAYADVNVVDINGAAATETVIVTSDGIVLNSSETTPSTVDFDVIVTEVSVNDGLGTPASITTTFTAQAVDASGNAIAGLTETGTDEADAYANLQTSILNSLSADDAGLAGVTTAGTTTSGGGNLTVGGTLALGDIANVEADVTANTAKVGVTDASVAATAAVTANTAKVGYTDALVSANADVTANTAKVGYTDAAVDGRIAGAMTDLGVSATGIDGVIEKSTNGDGDQIIKLGSNTFTFNNTTDTISTSSGDINLDADVAITGDLEIAGDVFVGGRSQGLQSQIDTNREDIDANTRGIAMVAALQHTTVLPGMTHALDISAAHFEGETGMALNYARRINDNVQINFGAASTTDFEESVIKAGVGIQW